MARKLAGPLYRRLRKNLARLGYCSKPTFLIIGAQKAGTSALFSMLNQHPKIVAPRNKEMAFFHDKQVKGGIAYGDFSTYHGSFPPPYRLAHGKMTFEATPAYLVFPECPKRIYDYNPKMKLIAILRDPVARAYSSWNMYRNLANSSNPTYRLLAESRTFEDAIATEIKLIELGQSTRPYNYVRVGIYAEHLESYFHYFPRDAMLVLDHADFLRNPETSLAATCRFLEIDPAFEFSIKREHVSAYDRPIPAGTADILRSFYRPMNSRLCALLNREFEWGKR